LDEQAELFQDDKEHCSIRRTYKAKLFCTRYC